MTGFPDEDIDTDEPREHSGQALPRIMLETALGHQGVKEVSQRPAYSLVVETPAADYAAPVQKALRKLGEWDHGCTVSKRKRPSEDDRTSEFIMVALARGGRVYGISHQPRDMLPPALYSGADRVVKLPPPSPDVIARTILAVTGALPVDVPPDLGAGLAFEEIAGAIRRGSSPAECVSRLLSARSSPAVAEDDDVPHVKDVHGMGEAKTWAEELVQDVSDWRAGRIDFKEIARPTAVLSGPPGVGKTQLMRSLAKSAELPLVVTSVGEWFTAGAGYLDSVVKQIDRVFAEAKAIAPSILFLDEMDAVPSRARLDSRNSDWWTTVVTHLLTTVEKTLKDEKILLVAASNAASNLDPALLRQGRFGNLIEVGPPDEAGLAGILRQHLGGDLPGEDMSGVARLAAGSTGADVVAWVRSARRTARVAARPMVMADLVDVIAPREQRQEEELWRIAIHESGHAVAAHVLGIGQVELVSLVRRGEIGGFVKLDGRDFGPSREDVERNVVQMLAGRAAEEHFLGAPGIGAGGVVYSDLAKATRYLGLLHFSAGLGDSLVYRSSLEDINHMVASDPDNAAIVERHLRSLYGEALNLIQSHSAAVERLARELTDTRQVGGDRFVQLFSGHAHA